jgi:DNA (cytosine-5)-methyltransferase 1
VRFAEWLMGLAGPRAGWVTDVDIPRSAHLRALGNGVVPQQAAHAVRLLLADALACSSHAHSGGPRYGEEMAA